MPPEAKNTVVLKLDPRDPDLSKIRDLSRAAREGKIIAFPTETVYGMGACFSAPEIVSRLNTLKNRPPEKPYSYHLGGWDQLETIKVRRDPVFRFLAKHFMPGPLTLLVKNLQGETVGIRYPKNRLCAALISSSGEPFVATSANLSGAPSPRSSAEVLAQLGNQIDYLIDGGQTELGTDSTVLDLTGEVPVIVRRGGAAEVAAIEKVLALVKEGKFPRKKILFVCTGNSCRSPMAAVWLESELRAKGLKDQIEVASCGIGARFGASSTSEAILVMKNREIDLSEHRSRPCSREDVIEADLVFAMSQEHFNFMAGLVPSVKEKIRVLNIPDPIGMGFMMYEEVIKSIERKLREQWKEIVA